MMARMRVKQEVSTAALREAAVRAANLRAGARAAVLAVEGSPIEIEEVARHRNGIKGASFHVVAFRHRGRPLVGILFEEPGHVAVFERELLGQGVVEFGQNSWRGDLFEKPLRRAVRRRR